MIWVHSEAEAWEAAKVVSDDGKSVTVRLQSTDKTVTISGGVGSHDSILPGSLSERCDNLVELESFCEGIILHHIRVVAPLLHDIGVCHSGSSLAGLCNKRASSSDPNNNSAPAQTRSARAARAHSLTHSLTHTHARPQTQTPCAQPTACPQRKLTK